MQPGLYKNIQNICINQKSGKDGLNFHGEVPSMKEIPAAAPGAEMDDYHQLYP